MAIPEQFHDLFEKETFAHFATKMPDGTPQVTPVWVDYDAESGHLLINTERNRRKEKNVRADPQVGVSMVDPEDPYRFVSVRGEVVEITEEGADVHIDALAQRYFDVEEYPSRDREQYAWVVLRISTDEVATS
ncbi:PPOX class F420-dependent oxidoreductase [Halomarina rubra]|uniref:PPOX class F420-dependent oxidoreductase n=1 Tax=Halomarina rubra TaxID=2071873 RepID=A0ABD6AQS6_9EURY|nr:PPOX class F420-dependent oxidoreductase [Halomarina rubra]